MALRFPILTSLALAGCTFPQPRPTAPGACDARWRVARASRALIAPDRDACGDVEATVACADLRDIPGLQAAIVRTTLAAADEAHAFCVRDLVNTLAKLHEQALADPTRINTPLLRFASKRFWSDPALVWRVDAERRAALVQGVTSWSAKALSSIGTRSVLDGLAALARDERPLRANWEQDELEAAIQRLRDALDPPPALPGVDSDPASLQAARVVYSLPAAKEAPALLFVETGSVTERHPAIVVAGRVPKTVPLGTDFDQSGWVHVAATLDRRRVIAVLDTVIESPGQTLHLLRSDDGGRTWRRAADLKKPSYVGTFTALHLDAAGHGDLVITVPDVGGAPPGEYAAHTRDWGRTWTAFRRGPDVLVAPDPAPSDPGLSAWDALHPAP